MDINQHPDYLRGYGAGARVHAVQTLADDERPLAHGHGPRKAICGAYVAVKPVQWGPSLKLACKNCIRITVAS